MIATTTQYFAPQTVEEAVELLDRFGGDAKVIAGGQSLMPLINLRMVRPAALVDITRIRALHGVTREGAVLRIGALTRHREVASDPLIGEAVPLLQAAARHIGHRQIRARGTIGGSLAHADPSAEYPTVCVALDAWLDLAGSQGRRSVPAGDFFLGPLTTQLLPGELVTAVNVPVPAPGTGWGFREFAPHEGDFALVVVAALLRRDEADRITWVRLAVGGVDPVPRRCEGAEAMLLGRSADEGTIREAADQAASELQAEDDLRASARYRLHLVRVLVRAALLEAVTRARP